VGPGWVSLTLSKGLWDLSSIAEVQSDSNSSGQSSRSHSDHGADSCCNHPLATQACTSVCCCGACA
jgi:hypothetical protein